VHLLWRRSPCGAGHRATPGDWNLRKPVMASAVVLTRWDPAGGVSVQTGSGCLWCLGGPGESVLRRAQPEGLLPRRSGASAMADRDERRGRGSAVEEDAGSRPACGRCAGWRDPAGVAVSADFCSSPVLTHRAAIWPGWSGRAVRITPWEIQPASGGQPLASEGSLEGQVPSDRRYRFRSGFLLAVPAAVAAKWRAWWWPTTARRWNLDGLAGPRQTEAARDPAAPPPLFAPPS